MDITNLSLNELKALAYDLLIESNRVQGNLKIVNDQISAVIKKEKEQSVEKEVKEEKPKKK